MGNTQQKLKIRMGQHFLETKNLANGNGKISDTFAKHFASHLKEKMEKGELKKAKTCDVRDLVKMSILWEGNAISCNKSFGKISCQLCMNERIEILKQIKSDKKLGTNKSINSNSEIYGSCRHRPKFHRFFYHPPSTDEEQGSSERVCKMKKNEGNPPAPLSDISNLLVCREVSTDLESRYNFLSTDV